MKLPDNRLSHELFRLKIDMEMKIAHPLRRCRTDGGNFRRADLTRIVVKFEKHFEEGVHAIRTRKQNPVVPVRVLNELTELAQIGWRFDPNRRQLKDVRAESAQLTTQRTGLFSRSRDHNPFSREWTAFVPF